MKVSVVIPCYNEVGTIAEIVSRVQSVAFDKEIIIVDDGSRFLGDPHRVLYFSSL